MKLTDEVAKALQNCVEGFGSIAELSRRTGVRIELLSRYLDRQTKSIEQDTWGQLYPLIKPYLNTSSHNTEMPKIIGSSARMHHDMVSLVCDEKILLDAFTALPAAEQQKILASLPKAPPESESIYQQMVCLNNDEKHLLEGFAALPEDEKELLLNKTVERAEAELTSKRSNM